MSVCFVYIMQCESFYKIGISGEPTSRLGYISAGTPFDVNVVDAFPFDDRNTASDVEMITHERLKDMGLHKKLEWFSGDLSTIKEQLKKSIKEAHKLKLIRDNNDLDKIKKIIDLIGVKKLSEISGVDLTKISGFKQGDNSIYAKDKRKIFNSIRALA